MSKVLTFKSVMILFTMILCTSTGTQCAEIDMTPYADDLIALANPHKGWYHHYYDNHVNKYLLEDDKDLLDFPGMDHLYLRLAWAYLEPEEGQYQWDIIDRVINKWTALGFRIAFRISCRETGTDRVEQQYATPKWVMEAGAKGGYYRNGERVGPGGPWEPVFDDPVYLAKLAQFLKAFAQRYDGQPWLRYIDIGSIGDWGEGHTWSGSRMAYNYQQRKTHIDLYCKAFKQTQLVVTDDFVYEIKDSQERQAMHRYVQSQGITYRDDSILVDYYIGAFPDTVTVRSPEFFADVYRDRPTVLELEHYRTVRKQGNWLGQPESSLSKYGKGKQGGDFLREALSLLHATYIGFHGDAKVWLAENPALTKALLNRCGYWFFLNRVTMPDTWQAGQSASLQMAWQNKGVAPAYHAYTLIIRLAAQDHVQDFELESGNQQWSPDPAGQIYLEDYTLKLPDSLPPGPYQLKLKLYAPQEKQTVLLALNPARLDNQTFYQIVTVDVTAP